VTLSDALAAAPTTRQLNNPCTVALLLAQITAEASAEEASRVDALLRDANRVASNLATVLRENGHAVTATTIRRHRKGECSCSPTN
jgi:hypothetical protein